MRNAARRLAAATNLRGRRLVPRVGIRGGRLVLRVGWPSRSACTTSLGFALLGCAWLLTAASPNVQAQSTWEYSPYRILVWVAFGTSAELTEPLRDQIATTLRDRGYVAAGASWDMRAAACPPELARDVAERIGDMTVEDIRRADERRLSIEDKVILLSVRAEPSGFHIRARELDCRSRTWQPLVHRQIVQSVRIADEAFSAVRAAFTPLVRVESVKTRDAEVRVRAGGLIMQDSDPSYIRDQDVLRPVIRRNDRLGEPLENGVAVVPWTFLTITARDNSLLACQVHSGMYSTLAVRAGARMQKFALVANPPEETTQLRLMTRGANPAPLPGYEIYSKDPHTEDTVLVGKSDWRGALTIRRDEQPLQILYVRNGGQLLARLPMVPGLEPQLTAEVRNDNRRLEAEGYVKGLQNTVMDLVARRELYIARFRRHLKAKEFDQAKALLEEFNALKTRVDLNRELVQQGQRFASSDISDRREQTKIDQLFKDTQQLLTRFLDPGTNSNLAAELDKARSAG